MIAFLDQSAALAAHKRQQAGILHRLLCADDPVIGVDPLPPVPAGPTVRQRIMTALQDAGGPMNMTAILRVTGLRSEGSARTSLCEMVQAGMIERTQPGHYRVRLYV